jgi:hypothetical protein
MIPSGKDTHIFTGVMDMDTEARYFAAGNYRYLLNARTTINTQGSFGALEDVMGNVLVANPYLQNGRNKVIGSCEDIAGQSCIFFVWNEFGYHGIFRWYANRVGFPDGVIETIYQILFPGAYNQDYPDPLNFQENKLITGVNLVNNELYWTDYYGQPKMIDIDRANNTDKLLRYDFYLNSAASLLTPTTYTFLEYNNSNIVNSYPITSTKIFFRERLEDISNQINALNLGLTSYYENDYLILECAAFGNTLVYTDTEPIYKSRLLANNFYYDTPDTEIFYRIKHNPFCRPDAYFYPQSSTIPSCSIPTGTYTGYLNSLNNPTGVGEGIYPLSNSVNSGGKINTAAATLQYYPAPPNGPTVLTGNNYGYITSNTTEQITLNLTATCSAFGIGANTASVDLIFINGNTILNTINIATLAAGQTITLTNYLFNYTFPAPIGTERIAIKITVNHASVALEGAISFTDVNLSIANNLGKARFLIRAKYIYYNNQESVFSQSTSIVLPQGDFQKYIRINLDDRYLQSDDYCSLLKKIVLTYSDDNGLTWFNFQELNKYQFACDFTRKYDFNNYEIGITISAQEASLQYHAIPLKSKSQEYIDNRIWDGGVVEDYDNINIDASINYSFQYFPANDIYTYSKEGFKFGHSGYFGIVYYDNFDRKTAVQVIGKGEFAYYPSIYANGRYPAFSSLINAAKPALPLIKIEIKNNPPKWATKYRLVRTQDLSNNGYLVWTIDKFEWLAQDLTVTTNASAAKWIKIYLTNIVYTIERDFGLIVNYTFNPGDRLKIISLGSLTMIPIPDDVEILQTPASTPDTIVIAFNANLQANVQQGSVIEIYTPGSVQSDDNLIYYEMGECYEIKEGPNNVKYHTGNIQNQNIATNTPAIIESNHGGTYYYTQTIYNNTTAPTPVSDRLFIPSAYVSAYIPDSKFDGLTRPNVVSITGQVNRKTGIRFSEKFISDQKQNGLNANYPLNSREYDVVNGLIAKMQVVDNDILKLVFANSKQMSIYVNQGIIRQNQGGTNIVSVIDDVAANTHIIQRTLGTLNGESVIVNDEGDMFGYDENEGVVWISSGNGLMQISDRGMKSVFKRYSNERKATGGISETPSVYDLYHDEYILTLGDINGFTGVTIAYNKQKQGWTSYYSFVPEYYGRVRDYVVSFKDGQLWKHDASLLAKNFYGTQYSRELKFISNKDFPKVKQYKAISVTGIGKNDAPTIFIPPYEGVPTGMLSSLSARFFETLEGIQYANLQKDKLSPGFGGNQLQALVNGRNLKGQTIEITLLNTDITKSSIYSADVVYFYSENS